MAFSFGQPAQANPTAGSTTPSFSFGGAAGTTNTSTQQQQQPPKAPGLGAGFSFGGSSSTSAAQPQSQGLFGASTSQPQQPGTSLFGAQQQQPKPPGLSLFGAPAANNSTNAASSLFGNQTQQQQQQQQQGGGGLFGAGNRPAFGQSTTTTTNTNPPNPLTLSQLGSTTSYSLSQSRPGQPTGLFGSTNAAGGASVGPDAAAANKRLGIPINDKLELIRASWDVQNIQTCRFLYYFYNSIPNNVPPQAIEEAIKNPNFGRRQDAVGSNHDALWLQTLRENPDRSKLVPVLAVGFEDLKTRVGLQESETARQSGKLVELQKKLDELTSKHSVSNSVRISAISRKQTTLHHRLMGLSKRIHLLIPALRGHSITHKEEQLKNLLHICEMELESISSVAGNAAVAGGQIDGGRMSVAGKHNANAAVQAQHRLRGRINELWALLANLKAKREAAAQANGGNAPLEWAVVDEGAIEDVVKILASQQQGLDHISSTIQNDTKALETIIKGLEGVELIGIK